jgi:predicted deacylase
MTSPIALQQRVVTGAGDGPHLLVTAGVHGDEFEGMAAIRLLLATLEEKRFKGRVTVVPIVNEPAFLLGRRTADDGRDLARSCPGDPEGSITERIADALSGLICTADAYIDLHSGGTTRRVAPLAGYMLHTDAGVLDMQRRMAVAFGLPLVWGTSPTLPGRSLSVARDAGIPAIYTEYLGGGVCDPSGVARYHAGCVNVMTELDMIRGEKANPRQPLIIEDDRPGSGQLQMEHPAPFTGYFETLAALGQNIATGELIGRMVNGLGDKVDDVPSQRTGIVICLTTFPRVTEGDGLAVVLETNRPSPYDALG